MITAALASKAIIGLLASKKIRYFIDSVFRDKVKPVPGSVLYCDLWVGAEHSGVYVSAGKISNVEVDGFADSEVRVCGPESFTSKSWFGRRIYVSCDGQGAVGAQRAADYAAAKVGQRSFYGLVFKNCHQFSTNCVQILGERQYGREAIEALKDKFIPIDWEPTLRELKRASRIYLGASKWRLWDWQESNAAHPEEPEWELINEQFCNEALNEASIRIIRNELAETNAYMQEISDEAIPADIRERVQKFQQTLECISTKYEDAKTFLATCPDSGFSYRALQNLGEKFELLAAEMAENTAITELARKLGRNHISEEKKRSSRIPEAARNELFGIQRSDDVSGLLPAELVNFEDETLETQFFARLAEKNLLTYELAGFSHCLDQTGEAQTKKTGPVVACIDTSGSMKGKPMRKAKALLLTIANILKREHRSLHVLMFGSTNELQEFTLDSSNESSDLLQFLKNGFGGGTNFETPLRRAMEIIESEHDFLKADILMISDGRSSLSTDIQETIRRKKLASEFTIYSVLCSDNRSTCAFSDESIFL